MGSNPDLVTNSWIRTIFLTTINPFHNQQVVRIKAPENLGGIIKNSQGNALSPFSKHGFLQTGNQKKLYFNTL